MNIAMNHFLHKKLNILNEYNMLIKHKYVIYYENTQY